MPNVKSLRFRNLTMIGLGVVCLLISRHYSGEYVDFIRAHGANFSFSFAAFFLLALFPLPANSKGFMGAGLALAGVWGQELAQKLAIYPGVYDPVDLFYDGIGVGAALLFHLFVPWGRTNAS